MTTLNLPPTKVVDMDDQERIAELERWRAGLDARNNTLWEQQHKWNGERESELGKLREMIETKFELVFKRLGGIEKRIAWFSGIAAAAGGSVGWLI